MSLNKKRSVALIILLNLVVVAMEIVFGLYANSVSLLADAVHNLGDVLAVIVTFIALLLASKEVSERMTFGYLRAEMMAGFVNAFFLLFSMIYVLYESFDKLLHPEAVKSEYMMVVALVALVANGFSALLLHKLGSEFVHQHEHGEHDTHHGDHHHHHHGDHDLNIRSAYLHMLSDALVSLGVIIGGAGIYFFGIYAIDPLLTILFSVYIFKETFGVLKHTFFSLIDINRDDLGGIERMILANGEIQSIHDLHVYRPSSKEMYLTSHLVFDKNLTLDEVEKVLLAIREELKTIGVTHSVLQPETITMAQDNFLCSAHP